MIRLLILFFIFQSVAFAQIPDEEYLVEKPDGSVEIINYIPGSRDTIQDVLISRGMDQMPVVKLKPGDLPADGADRKYWKRGVMKVIEIDTVKKQADLAAEAQRQSEVDTILGKMCPTCTREDLNKVIKNG